VLVTRIVNILFISKTNANSSQFEITKHKTEYIYCDVKVRILRSLNTSQHESRFPEPVIVRKTFFVKYFVTASRVAPEDNTVIHY
jgi:hypothetical protein